MTDPHPTASFSLHPPAASVGDSPTLTGSAAPGDLDQTTLVPTTPPGYVIEGELGRGGMGVVYKARQLALDRSVALKIVLGGGHASATARSRFLAEATAAAAIRHPGIARVYELGDHAGLPRLVFQRSLDPVYRVRGGDATGLDARAKAVPELLAKEWSPDPPRNNPADTVRYNVACGFAQAATFGPSEERGGGRRRPWRR
jgi:hypothetical protein